MSLNRYLFHPYVMLAALAYAGYRAGGLWGSVKAVSALVLGPVALVAHGAAMAAALILVAAGLGWMLAAPALRLAAVPLLAFEPGVDGVAARLRRVRDGYRDGALAALAHAIVALVLIAAGVAVGALDWWIFGHENGGTLLTRHVVAPLYERAAAYFG